MILSSSSKIFLQISDTSVEVIAILFLGTVLITCLDFIGTSVEQEALLLATFFLQDL